MSSDPISEKTAPPPLAQGRARCTWEQLQRRAGWKYAPPKWELGAIVGFESMMGERETWRVVEAGKDPLLEREQ